MISANPNNLFYSLCLLLFLSVIAVHAQSTNSDYPTAVTANEIRGIIKARDVGDSRSTRYFYKFTGTPGDLNLIIESENLNGDVDVFTLNGLRPLTKVSFFDTGSKFVATATVFLRKREVLLLRVEAKSASENAGNFRIQLSGGFEPIADTGNKQPDEPTLPKAKTSEGAVKVNSVGARIEEPKPPIKETPATNKTETASTTKSNTSSKTPGIKTPTKAATTAKTQPATQPKTTNTTKTNTDTSASTTKKETLAERRKRLREEAARAAEERKRKQAEAKAAEEQRRREAIAKANADKARKEAGNTNNSAVSKPNNASTAKAKEPPPPDPMASVRLVVETKDGQKIERTMNEVRRVNVEKGVLVVVFIDGKTERIPMTNVQKMAIEPLF